MIGALMKSSFRCPKCCTEEEHPSDFSTKHNSLQVAVFSFSQYGTPALAPHFFFPKKKKKKKKNFFFFFFCRCQKLGVRFIHGCGLYNVNYGRHIFNRNQKPHKYIKLLYLYCKVLTILALKQAASLETCRDLHS